MKAREPTKQRCQPGEFYCLGCRAPKRAALDMADYHPRTVLRGLLSGICPDCGKMIYRAASLAKLAQTRGGLDVAFPNARRRLDDSVSPFSSADDKEVQETGSNATQTTSEQSAATFCS